MRFDFYEGPIKTLGLSRSQCAELAALYSPDRFLIAAKELWEFLSKKRRPCPPDRVHWMMRQTALALKADGKL